MDDMAAHGDDWAAFLASNWALHERVAAITPNELARGVYAGTIRCVAELAVPAGTEQQDDAADYLALRVAVHAELVEAIVSGDVERTRAAVEAHRGISMGSDAAFEPATEVSGDAPVPA